ncbi:MAG: hypothetical protein R3F34_13715 [Planctomycetota bacterium]
MVRIRRSHLLAAALVLSLSLLEACGDGGGSTARSAGSFQRNDSTELVELRDAIDHLRLAEARTLIDQVGPSSGPEEPLLRARLAALGGDTFEALRLVRGAREANPNDPRPAATLVEILAWNGKLTEASQELEAARAVHGRTPELVRAHGVIGICTQGGSRSGLQLLEEAERADPALPFLGRALGEAHLLAANAAMNEGRTDDAVTHARASLDRLPGDERARETLADALATGIDFDRAVELYEELLAENVAEVQPKLVNALKNAATAAMLTSSVANAEARERIDAERESDYLRMRELGVRQGDLGIGTSFLARRAGDAIDEALSLLDSIAALERLRSRGLAGDDVEQSLVESRAKVDTLVSRALHLDPTSLKARVVRAELLFDHDEFAQAAQILQDICNENAEDLDALEVPIHLNAARAWFRAEQPDRARRVLRDYLAASHGALGRRHPAHDGRVLTQRAGARARRTHSRSSAPSFARISASRRPRCPRARGRRRRGSSGRRRRRRRSPSASRRTRS